MTKLLAVVTLAIGYVLNALDGTPQAIFLALAAIFWLVFDIASKK